MSTDYTPETHTIQLTKGQVTIVDCDDYQWLSLLKWHARYDSSNRYYATHTTPRGANKKQLTISMHRMIYETILGRKLLTAEIVDHINNDSLDNRRINLRLTDRLGNNRNRKISKNNKSGYKGVSWMKQVQKWIAWIHVDGKNRYLGLFDTPELAHEAYKQAAIKHYGEFARFE